MSKDERQDRVQVGVHMTRELADRARGYVVEGAAPTLSALVISALERELRRLRKRYPGAEPCKRLRRW